MNTLQALFTLLLREIGRLRIPLSVAGGCVGAAILLALIWPLPSIRFTETVAAAPPANVPLLAPPKPAAAFRNLTRWGDSLAEIEQRRAKPVEPAPQRAPELDPALREIGYIGLIEQDDAVAVVLAMPEGNSARFVVGDVLPDGRRLLAADARALELADEAGAVKHIDLFPRPVVDDEPSADDAAGDDMNLE